MLSYNLFKEYQHFCNNIIVYKYLICKEENKNILNRVKHSYHFRDYKNNIEGIILNDLISLKQTLETSQ